MMIRLQKAQGRVWVQQRVGVLGQGERDRSRAAKLGLGASHQLVGDPVRHRQIERDPDVLVDVGPRGTILRKLACLIRQYALRRCWKQQCMPSLHLTL